MFTFGLIFLVVVSLLAVKSSLIQKRKEKELILPVDVVDENHWETYLNIIGIVAMASIIFSFCGNVFAHQ
jgi:hypothetical protein